MMAALGEWQGFFQQLSSFLDISSRRIDSACEEYCDSTQERLQTSITNLRRIQDVLASAPNNLDIDFTDDELQALTEYHDVVTELLEVVLSLSRQYEECVDRSYPCI